MLHYTRQFIAVKVDQLSAFLTFAMKTNVSGNMALCFDIFKAGRAVCINDVFIHYALVHKAFKPAIYSCLPDGRSLLLKVCANISSRDMASRNRFKIIEQGFPLSGIIL